MSKILAVETATKICSVALSDGGAILAESRLNVPQVHVERLVICVNELLENLHLKYSDLDAVAVSNGPGSFTGLRIGLSVAKGIVFARDCKLIAVPTLDSLALGASTFAGDNTVVPLLHARADEFYYGAFRTGKVPPEKTGEYDIAEASVIAGKFDAGTIFVGEGAGTFSKSESISEKFGIGSMRSTEASAREVAILAEHMFARGEFADLRTLAPLYIKDFVAIKGNPLSKLSRKMPADKAKQKSGVEKS